MRARIALVFGALASLLIIATAFGMDAYIHRQSFERDSQRLANIARRVLEVLSQDLEERRRELISISRFPLLRSGLISIPERREALQSLKAAHVEYEWLGFADASGRIQVGTGTMFEGQDASKANWFTGARNGVGVGRLVPGGPAGKTPGAFAFVAVPVRDDSDRLIGVLAAHMATSWVEERRAELLRGGGALLRAEIMIVDGQGRIEYGASPASELAPAVRSLMAEAAPVARTVEWSDGDWTTATANAPRSSALGTLGLSAVVRRSARDTHAEAQAARTLILAGGSVAALVLMLAAWSLAGRITRPLQGVAVAASRIAKGGSAEPFPAVVGQDEVAQLTATLKMLLEQLLEEQHNLEAKVDERTQALMAANRDLEAFSYSVSHDLRAPLRAIHGFANLLREEFEADMAPLARDRLARVILNAEVMSERFEGLLSLARISRDSLVLREVPLGEIAAEIAEGFTRGEPGREATFQVDRSLRTQGDPRLLRLALENLLGNAWKYTSEVPETRIEFGCKPETGEFYVRDNGAGFDMAWAGGLFTPFHRLHDATLYPGTGIGLASVRRIVERHGGAIRAEATPGRGATFYFSLGGKEAFSAP